MLCAASVAGHGYRIGAQWGVCCHGNGNCSPFVGIRRRVAKQDRKRSRVLTDDELRRIWHAADEAGAFGALAKLLLLTAQRLEEVRTLRWSDISPDGVWTIPTEKREKGNAGALKLPKLALDIIAAQPRLAGNPHVFAGNGGDARAVEQRHKVALDKASGVTDWRLHVCAGRRGHSSAVPACCNDHAESVRRPRSAGCRSSTICTATIRKKPRHCAGWRR